MVSKIKNNSISFNLLQPTINVPTNGSYSWRCCRWFSYCEYFSLNFSIDIFHKHFDWSNLCPNFRVTLLDTLWQECSQAEAIQKKLHQQLLPNQTIANSQLLNSNNNKMVHAHGKLSNSCNALKTNLTSPYARDSMKLSANAKPQIICCKSNTTILKLFNSLVELKCFSYYSHWF